MQAAPSVTRDVAVASPPSREIESGRGLAKTLSPTQTESKRGSASARRARSMSCAEVVTPKKTPRCGRVRPRPRSAAKRVLPIRVWSAVTSAPIRAVPTGALKRRRRLHRAQWSRHRR